MINSPGGVQAGRDGYFGSTLIQSMALRVEIDRTTPPTRTGDPATSVGYQSAVALFTTNENRIRFVTDFQWSVQQAASNTLRMAFNYVPESPDEILGKDISYLQQIGRVGFNYSHFYTDD